MTLDHSEITKLHETIAAQANELTTLRLQCISDFGQYVDGTHALQEKIQAQAAVIEKLREALDELVDLVQDIRAEEYKPDSFTCQPALAALAIPTDSTQILDEVRRAERERCAKLCAELRHTGGFSAESADWNSGTMHCAAAIRAME